MYFKESVKFPWEGRSHYRIPSIIVTNNGTVLAFCNDRKDTSHDATAEVSLDVARKKPGCDWEPVKTLLGYPGWSCAIGTAVYDPDTDTAMCFSGRNPIVTDEWKKYSEEEKAEIKRQAALKAEEDGLTPGGFLLCSTDNGDTWFERKYTTVPAEVTHTDGNKYTVGSWCHGCAHGIQLKYGEHKGRLVCPSRISIGNYTNHDEIIYHVYNNCLYSDDHGVTWQASQPVQIGTGEGALIERGDGTLLHNSRAYFKDTKRRMAISRDGGETWGEFYNDEFLMEDAFQGCNAAFICVGREELKDASLLPEGADSITVFTNPYADERKNMCATVSFDEGKTWAKVKKIWEKGAAYSSIVYNPTDGIFYLMYERGETNAYHHGIAIAEFDLEWLLSDE